jgi:hypothetical protein
VFTILLAAMLLAASALVRAPTAASYPPTRSVPLPRARAAIRRTSPHGTRPLIGGCRRSREWTTCEVYESRTLSEEGGASYPVTLDFTECVGERGHRLIINTREVRMILRG